MEFKILKLFLFAAVACIYTEVSANLRTKREPKCMDQCIDTCEDKCKDSGENPENPGSDTSKMINGYYENYNAPVTKGEGINDIPSFYKNDIASCNHVLYSFLCLAQRPSHHAPPQMRWDGKALYETMTLADINVVMTKTDPVWDNPHNWQREKIAALIEAVHDNGDSFIWAIGGWSDLTKTLQESQIPAFVDKCIELLKLGDEKLGDGIDFDWEHLSMDPNLKDEQRMVLAKTMLALRKAIDKEGLKNKVIGYTTRFNAFWDNAHGNIPAGYTSYPSDGEGLTIEKALRDLGTSLNDVVDWVHIMMYDAPPSAFNKKDKIDLSTYVNVFDAFSKIVDKDKIVMGFEPGNQAAGGIWEGMEVDEQVIDYVQDNNFGGIMFWAMNEHQKNTGKNAQKLAKYAEGKFN